MKTDTIQIYRVLKIKKTAAYKNKVPDTPSAIFPLKLNS